MLKSVSVIDNICKSCHIWSLFWSYYTTSIWLQISLCVPISLCGKNTQSKYSKVVLEMNSSKHKSQIRMSKKSLENSKKPSRKTFFLNFIHFTINFVRNVYGQNCKSYEKLFLDKFGSNWQFFQILIPLQIIFRQILYSKNPLTILKPLIRFESTTKLK